ncbi:MAG TPA: glycoside hydrolase family 3 C-terminal domain-containing protein [Cellulomonas sp.]
MAPDATKVVPRLSLEEKAALLSGDGDWHTRALPHVGLAAVELADGPNGLRVETGVDMVWVPSTCFPTGSALGATWDRDIVRRVAVALGEEAVAMGVGLLLGPGINMKRTPLCGRNFEYFAEDPVVAGTLGAAYVEGVQSTGVGACLKHFAANNQETDRTTVSVEADERTLRETYLAAFERVVHRAQPWAVMCSYNRIGGVHASQHHWLLTEVLRDEWGYDGLVVSDWDAVHDPVAAVRAGLDLAMPGTAGRSAAALVAAVRAGALDETDVDRAARRVVELVARACPDGSPRNSPVRDLGVSPGARLSDEQRALLRADEHHALAREAAAAAITLLRNEGGVLPLDLVSEQTIAVIGGYARVPRIQGGGSAGVDPLQVDVPLEALRAIAGERVRYAQGYEIAETDYYTERRFDPDPALAARLADEAIALAGSSDVVVAFVGVPLASESEASDRATLALPYDQVALLERLGALGRPLVVVLAAGSAVTMDGWHDATVAILLTWLGGQGAGKAVADALFGRTNPSGRLAETFPLRLADTPAYLNFPGEAGQVRYGEGVFIGYRWYDARDQRVRYPFGHGLSYTWFDYDDLAVALVDPETGGLRVEVTVTNAGPVAGAEVVQLYIGDPGSAVPRPVRELRGFEKVSLAPGESARVGFDLAARDVAYFGDGAWRVRGGSLVVEVGASSRDLRARATVDVPDLCLPVHEAGGPHGATGPSTRST